LHKDPKKRPTLNDLRKEPFFAEIDWSKLERKELYPPTVLSKDDFSSRQDGTTATDQEMAELVNSFVIVNRYIGIII
jgi:hypothetical protein